jgi:tetratricopeptide (TPR) repeat protein
MLRIFDRNELPLSDEEIADRRYKRNRLTIILVIIVVLLIAGYFSARPAKNAVRGWQARRHAQKAFDFMEQQKWSEARSEAVAAYQLRSSEPQAIRAVARLLTRAGQADAVGFWKQLKSVAPLTTTDLRDEAAIAIRARESDAAEDAINQLLKQPDSKPSDTLLSAQLAAQKQDLEGATAFIHKVLGNSAATDRDRLQATVLLSAILRSKDAKDQTEVLQNLAKLGRGSNDVSLEALVSLGQAFIGFQGDWPNPDGMSGEDLSQALEKHPLAKAQHKLLAVDVRIRMNPDQREEAIHTVTAQLKDGDTAALVALAGWLYTHGEYQLELDTIPRDRAIQSSELFLQHVNAMAALDRWDEIRRLIESEQFPLDPVMAHMYLARCFMQQGQTAGAENNWRRALQAAAGAADKLMILGDYAEKNNAMDVAGSAYEAAVAAAPKNRVAQQGRLRVAYTTRETKRIHDILTELLKIWPKDLAIQNDEAYARLLLPPSASADASSGEDSPGKVATSSDASPVRTSEGSSAELKAIEKLAEELVKREPASLPHRTLLALARFKQGRTYDALAVFRGINVPRSALTTSTLAVHVAVLGATNEKEAARQEAALVPREKLLPEEQALVDEALKEN